MQMLGVDIGGSGIKGCLVDTETGELIGERHRIATPQPATPAAVAHTLKALVEHFQWKGPVGCGFPATIHNGIAKNASNIDKSWIETDAAHLFADVTGLPCHVLNDADAAGLAEMRFGTGRDRKGVIILITVGTGIYLASSAVQQIGPDPGPPPPCGVENVLCRLICMTSTPKSPGRIFPTSALKFAPSQ